jgi:hypothetical protein
MPKKNLRLVLVLRWWLAAIVGLFVFGGVALAAPPAVNPQSGSVGLSGTVTGPPPSTAATILTPASGTATSTIPITVSGSCSANDFVSVTDNNAFIGAAQCSSNGSYSLLVNLFAGSNALVAQISDALGQYGPNSATINILYNAPTLSLPGGQAGKQLFLQADTAVVAGDPGVQITRAATIVGGVAPYAVSWDWGDGSTTLLSDGENGPISASHAYTRPGTYNVIVKVSDNNGNSAYLQMVTVVNGKAQAVGATGGQGLGAAAGNLVSAWPLFGVGFIVVAAFWLGERRQLRKLRRAMR